MHPDSPVEPKDSVASRHTVIVHHHMPGVFPKVQVGSGGIARDIRDCSLPVELTVADQKGGFLVSPTPVNCPLCCRPFMPTERKRISDAAIQRYLETQFPGPTTQARASLPIDVVLDAP